MFCIAKIEDTPYQAFEVGHYNCPAVVVRNVEDEVSKLCPMKMRADGQSLIKDMVGFERKFKTELTKMRGNTSSIQQTLNRRCRLKGAENEGFRIAHDGDGCEQG